MLALGTLQLRCTCHRTTARRRRAASGTRLKPDVRLTMNAMTMRMRYWKLGATFVLLALGLAYWLWPAPPQPKPVLGENIEVVLIGGSNNCSLRDRPLAIVDTPRWLDSKLEIKVNAPQLCIESLRVAKPGFRRDGRRVFLDWEWQYPRGASAPACGRCQYQLGFILSNLDIQDYEIVLPKDIRDVPQ